MARPNTRSRYDEEVYDDYRPARPRRRRPRSRGPVVFLVVLAVALPLLGGGAALVYYAVKKSGDRPQPGNTRPAGTQPGAAPQEEGAAEKNPRRLIGKWSAPVPPSRRLTYDFRPGGRFSLRATDEATGKSVTSSGTWRVLNASGDTIRVLAVSGEMKSDMNIELLPGDRFRYTTPNGMVINASRVP